MHILPVSCHLQEDIRDKDIGEDFKAQHNTSIVTSITSHFLCSFDFIVQQCYRINSNHGALTFARI